MQETQNQIVNYSVTDAALEQMRKDCLVLRVTGVDDKAGYEACKKAQSEVRKKRTEVEEKRKELKADALEWGRKVDGEAKRITEQLEAVEDHLKKQRAIVDDYEKRLAEEREQQIQARANARIAALQKYRCVNQYSLEALRTLSDEGWAQIENAARIAFEQAEEKARLDKEAQAKQAAELKRLQEEKAASDKKAADQQAEIDRLKKEKADADQREFDRLLGEEEAEKQRERDRLAADQKAEQDKKDAADKAERDRLAAEEKARNDKENADRAEKERIEKVEAAKKLEEQLKAQQAEDMKRIQHTFYSMPLCWDEILRLTTMVKKLKGTNEQV